jgi:hypothetical protein
MSMTVIELKTETTKLSCQEQAELAAYLTERLRRATNDQKEGSRMTDDGNPNFTDPRDELLQTNRF